MKYVYYTTAVVAVAALGAATGMAYILRQAVKTYQQPNVWDEDYEDETLYTFTLPGENVYDIINGWVAEYEEEND